MDFEGNIVSNARMRLLKMHYEAGVGHIGGNLSALDMMLVLHHQVMSAEDEFVLSKGHSAGALYVTLWTKGLISDQQLSTFHADGTKLAGHPPPNWLKEIPFATGSLGHGASLACGMALAKRLQNLPGNIFCLLSDGELNEGSTWEALHFAGHHHLTNLTFLVDQNGLQGFGQTRAVMNMGDLNHRLAGLNYKVCVIDGHDHNKIRVACSLPRTEPTFVIGETIKGKGVSFMEGKMEWHYLPLNSEMYEVAIHELSTAHISALPQQIDSVRLGITP